MALVATRWTSSTQVVRQAGTYVDLVRRDVLSQRHVRDMLCPFPPGGLLRTLLNPSTTEKIRWKKSFGWWAKWIDVD
eukprot:scaffold10069_cov69-Cylindrotheca_fusiformis.AAC.9